MEVKIGEQFVFCGSCGKRIKNKKSIIKHHISYKPEKIITICRSCHSYIHCGNNKFSHLKPVSRSPISTIRLSDETHKKLAGYGVKGDTYETIILKLMREK